MVAHQVVQIAEEMLGVRFAAEYASEGVLSARLEGGAIFVLTDGTAGAEFDRAGYVAAALYSSQAARDSNDELA